MKYRENRLRWSKKELEQAVKESMSYSDVLRYLKLRTAGGNWKTIKKYISLYNLDVSHFDPVAVALNAVKHLKLSFETIFCENSTAGKGSVRTHYKKYSTYECRICLNAGIHCERPLVLQLDHINGNTTDNRIENLRWLCPNCHSQTSTFAGRSSNRISKFCNTCAIPTYNISGYCSQSCRPNTTIHIETEHKKPVQSKRSVNWPDVKVVEQNVKLAGFGKVGKSLGVSDTAVKKFLRRNGIVLPKYYTQTKFTNQTTK